MSTAIAIILAIVGAAFAVWFGIRFRQLALIVDPRDPQRATRFAVLGFMLYVGVFFTPLILSLPCLIVMVYVYLRLRRQAMTAAASRRKQDQPTEPIPVVFDMGWHPNPDNDSDGTYRFHDGTQWTDLTIPHLGPPQ